MLSGGMHKLKISSIFGSLQDKHGLTNDPKCIRVVIVGVTSHSITVLTCLVALPPFSLVAPWAASGVRGSRHDA